MADTGRTTVPIRLLWIATLFVLAVVSVSHLRVFIENRKLAVELAHLARTAKELKEELGVIEVADPKKVYVMPLTCHDHLSWKYRVYLPANKKFTLGIADDWASDGLPAADTSMWPIGFDRQFTMAISLRKGQFDVWGLAISMPNRALFSQINIDSAPWLADDNPAIPFTPQSANGTVAELVPDQPIPILSFRADSTASDSPEVLNDGLSVWLDPRIGMATRQPTALPLPQGNETN